MSTPTPKKIESLHFDGFVQKLPRMDGKTVAVTGCTSGTGLVFAKTLAGLGAKVVMLNRQSQRAEQAFDAVKKFAPEAKVVSIACDLGSFKSVRSAAALVIASCPEGLDILCNNAGMMVNPSEPSEDGVNLEIQTNHLSHFLLTAELWPLLEKAADERGEARVVNHSSIARTFAFHLNGGFSGKYLKADLSKLGGNSSFSRLSRYSQSKLANTLFTHALATKQTKVKALSAHPGISATSLVSNTAQSGFGDARLLEKLLTSPDIEMQSTEDGTLGILSAACLPSVESDTIWGPAKSGKTGPAVPEPIPCDYWIACNLARQTDVLWAESLQSTGAKFPF